MMTDEENWYWFKRLDRCYDLTHGDLLDSPLARKAEAKGYPSLTALLNAWNCWNFTVAEVESQLEQSHD